ncbi:MAG: hypothetical protein QM650_05300 [Microlunatus sp.]
MNESDDKASVDRAFADLVAGFHLTAERPESDQPSDWDEPVHRPQAPGSVFETPGPTAPPGAADLGAPPPRAPELDLPEIHLPEEDEEPEPAAAEEEHYDPGPLAPLPRPAWPVLVGWIGIGYAVLTVIVGVFGFPLPRWAAWAGVIAFAGGFGLLLSQLPRHRPPDAGDGAVL